MIIGFFGFWLSVISMVLLHQECADEQEKSFNCKDDVIHCHVKIRDGKADHAKLVEQRYCSDCQHNECDNKCKPGHWITPLQKPINQEVKSACCNNIQRCQCE